MIFTFMFLFLGASEPTCLDAADSDDDERLNVSDGIRILHDFFRQGTGLPYPGPFLCGPDPEGETLGCSVYPSCDSG